MVLVLDTTIGSFVVALNNFKKDFMNNLGPPYSSSPQWLTINSIQNSSVRLNATLTVPTNSSADEASADLENTLNNGISLGGLPLLAA